MLEHLLTPTTMTRSNLPFIFNHVENWLGCRGQQILDYFTVALWSGTVQCRFSKVVGWQQRNTRRVHLHDLIINQTSNDIYDDIFQYFQRPKFNIFRTHSGFNLLTRMKHHHWIWFENWNEIELKSHDIYDDVSELPKTKIQHLSHSFRFQSVDSGETSTLNSIWKLKWDGIEMNWG